MKRKSSRHRAMRFPARLVRPIENNHPNLVALSSPSALPGVRAKKIFVIKQEIRVPRANDARKKIRSILIFDDHPASLRLVFGIDANPHAHLPPPQRIISWELILAAILTMGALIGMFWPIL